LDVFFLLPPDSRAAKFPGYGHVNCDPLKNRESAVEIAFSLSTSPGARHSASINLSITSAGGHDRGLTWRVT
jgi:hypothetical protein